MDTEKFTGYWNEAVSAVVYRIHQMPKPVTAAAINQCWHEELLEHRFFSTGIRHGAAVWFSELEQAEPQVADRLRKALNESRYHNAGLDIGLPVTAGAAAVAAGGFLLNTAEKTATLPKVCGVLALAAGVGLLGKGAADTIGATNADKLCSAFRNEAQAQLSAILKSLNG